MNTVRQLPLLSGLIALLIIAFAMGGGGSRFGLANLSVQLAALAVLAAFPDACRSFWRSAPTYLRLLVGLSVALPLAQLVPLPMSVWSALPGRELAVASYELAGSQGWAPFSLYPLRTALAASALVTPLVVLCAAWSLPRAHVFMLGWLVVACGLVTVVIGAVQVSSGYDSLNFWDEGIRVEALLGTFANRNSTGLFLVGALSLALFLPAPTRHPAVLLGRLSVATLLITAVVLTKSRTALVLAMVPIAMGLLQFALARLGGEDVRARTRNAIVAAAIVLIGAAGIATTLVAAPGRIADTLERFEAFEDDNRRYIWDDATYTTGRYWPAGAGMGTFDEVFQVDESLENLGQRRAGRAHNDFIEVSIEAGLSGVIMVALWLLAVLVMGWQARRSEDRWAAWGAGAFLLTIALQSVTDYPLRNHTMLAIAAVALAVLARIAADPQEQGS